MAKGKSGSVHLATSVGFPGEGHSHLHITPAQAIPECASTHSTRGLASCPWPSMPVSSWSDLCSWAGVHSWRLWTEKFRARLLQHFPFSLVLVRGSISCAAAFLWPSAGASGCAGRTSHILSPCRLPIPSGLCLSLSQTMLDHVTPPVWKLETLNCFLSF